MAHAPADAGRPDEPFENGSPGHPPTDQQTADSPLRQTDSNPISNSNFIPIGISPDRGKRSSRLTDATIRHECRPDFWWNAVNSAGENRPCHRTFVTWSRALSRFLVNVMLWTQTKRELVPAVATVVALLMVEIGLGTSVDASCGAYLQTSVMGRDPGHGLSAAVNRTYAPRPTNGVSTFVPGSPEPMPKHLPCSRPGCSRGSMPPFVPALPVTAKPHRLEVCDVNSVAAIGNDFSGKRTSATSTAHALRGFPLTIEVPPEPRC